MKRTVERIVPLLPAVAAVGASVCASSLVFTNPPPPVEPQPLVTPATHQLGRVLASPVLLARPPSPRAAPIRRRGGLHELPAHAHRAESPPRPSSPVSPVVSPTPLPPAQPPNPPPAPAPAPPVTAAPTPAPAPQTSTQQVTVTTTESRPGWGRGDGNHNHTGPPGQASKGQDKKGPTAQPPPAQPPPPPPPVASGETHGNDHSGDKKSPGR
jgi:hypothetical protein